MSGSHEDTKMARHAARPLIPARQRPDRSFEWQSGTRTGHDIFVSSCETCWRNGWVLGGDLVQLNRILENKTELRLFRGLRTCHRN